MMRGTATAGSNIALLKYWGKRDGMENIPLNSSLSMTLSAATTTTTVCWDRSLSQDEVFLDGERLLDLRGRRVSRFLDRIRAQYYRQHARVVTMNSFPAGTGMASSASGFAALAGAALAAFDEGLPDSQELSRWARRGSGSGCRSVFGGFVEWVGGDDDESSFARPFLPREHWDLHDVVVIVSREEKEISSSDGHRIATFHPFMSARQALLPGRLVALQGALVARDFATLAALVEQEALEMHGIMLSGVPAAIYFQPTTITLLHAIRSWRQDEGVPVCFTLDAGPNVHVLCPGDLVSEVCRRLQEICPGASLVDNSPGPGLRVHGDHLL